jgi:hypothetical protein
MTCTHLSPGGGLTCSRTTVHDPTGTRGHVYVHPSSAPDLKVELDQHLDDVEASRIEANNR